MCVSAHCLSIPLIFRVQVELFSTDFLLFSLSPKLENLPQTVTGELPADHSQDPDP